MKTYFLIFKFPLATLNNINICIVVLFFVIFSSKRNFKKLVCKWTNKKWKLGLIKLFCVWVSPGAEGHDHHQEAPSRRGIRAAVSPHCPPPHLPSLPRVPPWVRCHTHAGPGLCWEGVHPQNAHEGHPQLFQVQESHDVSPRECLWNGSLCPIPEMW